MSKMTMVMDVDAMMAQHRDVDVNVNKNVIEIVMLRCHFL